MVLSKNGWKSKTSRSPGQRGTKQETLAYGEDLFRVRYRYNEELNLVIKTVELIVQTSVWKTEPEPERIDQSRIDRAKYKNGLTYRFGTEQKQRYIQCGFCGLKSFHRQDIKHRYCGNCKIYHDDQAELKLLVEKVVKGAKSGS